MANEFKIKKGLIVTGADGGTVVDIQGSQGQLFSVTDDLSGSIFAVSDISGVPILDVNSSGLVTIDGSLTSNGVITAPSFVSSTDSGISINGITMTRVAANSAIRVGNGLETLGLLRSYDALVVGTTATIGGDVFINRTGILGSAKLSISADAGEDVLGVQCSSLNTTTKLINVFNSAGVDIASITINNDSTPDMLFNVDNGAGAITEVLKLDSSQNATFAEQAFSSATSSGDASSTLTTKGYVDGLITGATIYRGAWQAGISATSSAATTASTTLTVTAAIEDADGNTPVLEGAVVTGEGITGIVKVASVTSSTVYVLDTAIDATATAYIFSPIYGAPSLDGVTETSGYYYICSETGSATPNGANSEPNTWNVGDWCIYNDVSGTGQWQKIDNSSVLSGAGTGQTVALWEGPNSVTDSDTLGNAPITVSGNDTAFAGNVTAYTGGASGSLGVGRTSDQSIKLYVTDANNKITAEQDSDGDAAHKFILNRVFAGTGANDFIIQKDGTAQFTLDTSANATFAGDIDVTGDIDVGTQIWKSYTNTAAAINVEVSGGNAINIFNTQESAAFLNFIDSQSNGAQYANLNFNSSGTNALIINNMGYDTTISNAGVWTFPNELNATTFLGELGATSTINTGVTGATQSAGNNSTLIATTAYADAAAAAVPIGNYLPLTGGALSGNLSISTPDTGSAPAITAMLFLDGYEGRGSGIKIKDSVNSAANPSNREWFVGSGYANSGFNIGYSATGSASSYSAQSKFNITTDGVVTIPGGVGIGTTSPNTLLDVSSANSGTTAPTVRITNTLNVGDWSEVTSDLGRFEFFTDDSSGNAPYTLGYIGIKNDYTSGVPTLPSGAMVFATTTYNASGGAVERMRIDSSGNVGIGTTTPENKLDILNNYTYETSTTVHNNAHIRLSEDTQDNFIANLNGGLYLSSSIQKGGSRVFLGDGATKSATIKTVGGSTGFVQFMTGSGITDTIVSETAKMTIANSGNVGIGTTTPDVRLEVVEASPTDGIIADFVNSTNAGGTTAAIKLSNADSEACDVVLGANRIGANFGSDFFISLSDGVDGSNQERFRITEAGNVGIGTTTPDYKLDIEGSSPFLRINNTAETDAGIIFQDSADAGQSAAIKYNSSDNSLSFSNFSSSVERMRIASNGNVGIGTTTPNAKLDVQGTQGQLFSVTDDLSGDIFSVADISGVPIMNVNSDGTSYFNGNVTITGGTTSTLFMNITTNQLYGDVNGVVILKANDNLRLNTNGAERMRITSSGNVGIGATNPQQKLHVAGNGRFESGATGLGGYVTVGNPQETAGNYSAYFFGNTIHDNTYMKGAIVYETLSITNGRGDMHFLQNSAANSTNASISDSVMTILNNGNVGIGTTTPSAKLEVNGDIDSTSGDGYLINGMGWAYEASSLLSLGNWNGDDFATRIMDENSNEVLRVASGGVGIGVTNPSAKLQVYRDDTTLAEDLAEATSRASVKIRSSSTDSAHLAISQGASGCTQLQVSSTNGTTPRNIKIQPFGGNVGIGTGTANPSDRLVVVGNVVATNFVLSSDERKKTKIKDLTCNNIDVNWRSFELKQHEGEYRTGVIAQELEQSHPEFVKTDNEGFKSVKYIDLLIAKIAELEARLEKLEK